MMMLWCVWDIFGAGCDGCSCCWIWGAVVVTISVSVW